MQSDFGLDDGAVSAMCGVAYTVSDDIRVESSMIYHRMTFE